MSFEFLKSFYQHSRDTLIWLIIYFVVQAIILILLGLLIWNYPEALQVLVVICFFLLSLLSIYFASIFIRYAYQLRKLKDFLTGNWK